MGADVVEDDTEHSQRTQAIYVGSVLESAQKRKPSSLTKLDTCAESLRSASDLPWPVPGS